MLLEAQAERIKQVPIDTMKRKYLHWIIQILDEIIIERPKNIDQHLCADKGYSGEPARRAMTERNYIPNVKQRGEEIQEKKTIPGYRARRWVVEVSHSWFNRFRKLLVRYEKFTETYMALLHMAAAIIAFRKVGVIYG